MEFLIGVINAIKKSRKHIKNAKLGARALSSGKEFIQILMGFVLGYFKGLLAYIVLVVLIISIIIGGIEVTFDYFKKKGGDNYSPSSLAASLTDQEMEELLKDGSSINPKKIPKYTEVEDSSYPRSATVQMKTIDDGKESKSNYTLDLTSTSYQYRTPWQLVASIDVIKDILQDQSDLEVINSAKNSLKPNFVWAYDKYTKDITDSRKQWVVETTQDKDSNGSLVGARKEVKNTKEAARQIDITKMYPLPFAQSVSTALKTYTYNFTENITTKDDPWSSPIVVGTPKVWEEQVQDGTEDDLSKPIYIEDKSSPVYGDDYTKPIYNYISYNRFKKIRRRTGSEFVDVLASVNGNYSFTGNEWFRYVKTEGSYHLFQDYVNGDLIIKLPTDQVSASEELYFKERFTKREWTGKYEQKIISFGKKIIGYEQKPKYKTVQHIETTYKIIKQKVVEDKVSFVTESLTPYPLAMFFNQVGISTTDLALVHDILDMMPDTTQLVKDINEVLEKDLFNDTTGAGGGGPVDTGGLGSYIPLFLQGDSRWGNIRYGDATIRIAGCGPTSMAMVLTGLQGNNSAIDTNGDGVVSPPEAAAFSERRGHYVNGVGTSWAFYSDIAKSTGLNVKQIESGQYSQVLDHLRTGNPVIASMGPGTFTTEGHFIVLTGITADGKITVNDPASAKKSEMSWDFTNIIVPQCKQYWLIDNPNMFNNTEVFTVTAYGGVHSAMEGGSHTADGTYLDDKDFRNRIIAVDRKKIKLGTKVYMEFPEAKRYQFKDGVKYDLNGWYTARDTGGAIKQNIIDLFMGFGGAEDAKRCNDFGRVDGVRVRWKK